MRRVTPVVTPVVMLVPMPVTHPLPVVVMRRLATPRLRTARLTNDEAAVLGGIMMHCGTPRGDSESWQGDGLRACLTGVGATLAVPQCVL